MSKKLISVNILIISFCAVLVSQSYPPTGGSLPNDSILITTNSSCPSGWSEYTAAKGRYLVALPSGGTVGAAVGTAYTSDTANDVLSIHTHTVTDPGHSHQVTLVGHIHDLRYVERALASGAYTVRHFKTDGSKSNTNSTSISASTSSATSNVTIETSGDTVNIPVVPYYTVTICRKP